ncbi:hypothetical protein E4634_05350 [Mangrovimicrobium sediminis]|uniref:Uncharacterized protein n=1 Tax=Mangrovimicrobium sediminis TaxID=2562682 RepID=A0A4Z0M5I1_9GAMM|nr:hypothetical protein [Haliea sp. SAOS-164]TGD74628.1 hypothetical protein E4634_05350 [Haliea sp. SAOS-164]
MLEYETVKLIATSTVVSAVVAGLIAFLSQHRLLARKAELDYEFEARKRLYAAVGPLRFQLLLAARDLVGRFSVHHGTQWNMDPDRYYVKSCVYRLLAPLAVGQLIQRQLSLVDFSVDREAVGLLRFVAAAERVLSGNEVPMGHPDADWSSQRQHLYRDNLRAAAGALITGDAEGRERLMTYAEFDREYRILEAGELASLGGIFAACRHSLTENPLFWLRVVAYTWVCAQHLQSRSAARLGFSVHKLPLEAMVAATADNYLVSRTGQYCKVLEEIVQDSL